MTGSKCHRKHRKHLRIYDDMGSPGWDRSVEIWVHIAGQSLGGEKGMGKRGVGKMSLFTCCRLTLKCS